MNEITTKMAYVCPISISGDVNQKEEMRQKMLATENLAQKYGGRVLPTTEFPDGFFLEVIFEDREILSQFKKELGIK